MRKCSAGITIPMYFADINLGFLNLKITMEEKNKKPTVENIQECCLRFIITHLHSAYQFLCANQIK